MHRRVLERSYTNLVRLPRRERLERVVLIRLSRFVPAHLLLDARRDRRQLLPQHGDLGHRGRSACRDRSAVDHNNIL